MEFKEQPRFAKQAQSFLLVNIWRTSIESPGSITHNWYKTFLKEHLYHSFWATQFKTWQSHCAYLYQNISTPSLNWSLWIYEYIVEFFFQEFHTPFNYRTRISRGLYIFYPIFYCGLYCRAVYNAEQLIFHDFFSSNLYKGAIKNVKIQFGTIT